MWTRRASFHSPIRSHLLCPGTLLDVRQASGWILLSVCSLFPALLAAHQAHHACLYLPGSSARQKWLYRRAWQRKGASQTCVLISSERWLRLPGVRHRIIEYFCVSSVLRPSVAPEFSETPKSALHCFDLAALCSVIVNMTAVLHDDHGSRLSILFERSRRSRSSSLHWALWRSMTPQSLTSQFRRSLRCNLRVCDFNFSATSVR